MQDKYGVTEVMAINILDGRGISEYLAIMKYKRVQEIRTAQKNQNRR
jgi:hypothetical protein